MKNTRIITLIADSMTLLTVSAIPVQAQIPSPRSHVSRLGVRMGSSIPPSQTTVVRSQFEPSQAAASATFGFGLIDYPRSPDSAAFGINSKNQIVGIYGANLPQWAGLTQSFLLSGDGYHTLSYPGAPYTNAFGINRSGEIVGWYYDASGNGIWHAFLRKGTTYTTIDYPGAQYSAASNINNAGQIIGIYYNAVGPVHGFTLKKGAYISIDPPGSIYTEPFGINSAGVIAGQYQDVNLVSHGFIYDNGAYTVVDYPGASNTTLAGINDSGQMVGAYGDDVIVAGLDWPTPHAFLLDNGTFTPFNTPVGDAQVNWVYSLSGKNFVGFYIDSLGNLYGYEATIGQ